MDVALARAIADAAYRTGRFRTPGGDEVDVLFDHYQVLSDPELLDQVARAMVPLLPEHVERLAGRDLGGVPLAVALGLVTGRPVVFVRRDAHDHGTGRQVEGAEVSGCSVSVVECVLQTDAELGGVVEALREAGALVDTVICLLDLRPSGDDWVEELAVHVVPLFVGDEVPVPEPRAEEVADGSNVVEGRFGARG